MSKFEDGMEAIEIALFETYGKEIPIEAIMLLNNLKTAYVIVTWPDSQELMEENWFEEEAILDVEGEFGSSAYFIPLNRALE